MASIFTVLSFVLRLSMLPTSLAPKIILEKEPLEADSFWMSTIHARLKNPLAARDE
jgi:hypothetical protein